MSSITNKTSSSKTFGREDMVALLSVDAAMPTASSGFAKVPSKITKEGDISTLNASETAAYLAASQGERNSLTVKKRHRVGEDTKTTTNKRKMEYHKLLEEQQIIATALLEAPQQRPTKGDESATSSNDDEGSDDDNRRRYEPEIIRKRHKNDEPPLHQQEDSKQQTTFYSSHPSASSTSSSDSDSTSNSESDEEIDARRRRIREKALAKENLLQKQQDAASTSGVDINESSKKQIDEASLKSSPSKDSSSSSGSSEDSSSDSSSEEEESPSLQLGTVNLHRPIFVPKNKRNTVAQQEKQILEDEVKKQQAQLQLQKRKLESRAMVKEVVQKSVREASILNAGQSLEEEDLVSGMGLPPPPDDNDICETAEEETLILNAWKVREVLRILRELDERELKEREQAELSRRRNMTDEERLAEDILSGKYQKPGSKRDPDKQTGNYLQRYYHKGAFFIDEAENDEVFKRAEEYARAATGQDKINFKALPAVMQVKKFGFARHSTKYKGLSKEDTTDKDAPQLLTNKSVKSHLK